MTVRLDDKVELLDAGQRRKVEARATELVAEKMTLRELRQTRLWHPL